MNTTSPPSPQAQCSYIPDFLPRQPRGATKPLLPWLVRRVEVIRGAVPIEVQCAPAFNYARSSHKTSIVPDSSTLTPQKKVLFESDALVLDLRYVVGGNAVNLLSPPFASPLNSRQDNVAEPHVDFCLMDLSAKGHKGPAACAKLSLTEGQYVTFVLRIPPTGGPLSQEGAVVEVPAGLGSKSRPLDDPFLTKVTFRETGTGLNH